MQTPKMVTIRDVAAVAGVSISTVSKALNGRSAEYQVNARTVTRVQAAAEQLSYVPNNIARTLRVQRTGQIGAVLNDLYRPDAAQTDNAVLLTLDGAMLTGLKMAAQAYRLQGVVLYPNADETMLADPRRYLDGRIDGLLVRSSLRSDEALLRCLTPLRLPLVLMWRQSAPDHAGYADVDHRGGAFLAVQHLLELGHRRITYLGPDLGDDVTHFDLRYQGYGDALRAAGLQSRPEWHVRDAAGMLELLRGAEPVTAVFAVSDRRAAELATELDTVGVRIPDDLSLVGFDNVVNADLIAGGLTTVYHPIQEMATQAVQHLLALIEGAPAEECRSVTPTRLVIRRSTAPPQPPS